MAKGALRLSRKNKKIRRIRKAKYLIYPGDIIYFCYSESILKQKPPTAELITDMDTYSIWFKPSGLLSQGNEFGDHFCLIRQAEIFFNNKRQAKVVHRLDKDACGLVLIAHSKAAANYFSELFRNHKILKKYQAVIVGKIGDIGEHKRLDDDVDGKTALTDIHIRAVNESTSEVEIILHTGRKHQIRKHLSKIGHPIVGDRLYGKRGDNAALLQLLAYQLSFICPASKEEKIVTLPVGYQLFTEQLNPKY